MMNSYFKPISKFLNKIPVQFKLYILVFVMFISFFSISLIAYKNIETLKHSVTTIYNKNLSPIVKLQTINHIYNNDIILTIYKVRNEEITPKHAIYILGNAQTKIDKLWNKFKYTKEIKNLIKTENLLLETYKKIETLKRIYKEYKTDYYKKINIIYIVKHGSKTANEINKLIAIELSSADIIKTNVLNKYSSLKKILMSIIFITLIVSILITIPIIKNIKFTQYELYKYIKRLRYSNKQLEDSAIKDPMTNLFNRRHFELLFTNELKRAKREKKFVTFMMYDIDFFKPYNDTYGHQKGDTAIIAVANTLQQTFKRPSDYNFRLGGEEFASILYDTPFHYAQKLASIAIQNIHKLKIEHSQSSVASHLTISIGTLTISPDKTINIDKIVLISDKNLYNAKKNGRDQAVTSLL